MDFNEYQRGAHATAIYPGAGEDLGLFYTGLGLVNEAGEVAGKIKKYIRDDTFDAEAIADELSDVLWYVAMTASELGYRLDEIAQMNLDKLASRAERGVLAGSGDKR